MGHSKSPFILILFAAYFTTCHSRPNSIENSNEPSLFHRQANESADNTQFQYSPSWFNTKSQSALWKSALNVNTRTRSLLFSSDSTILEDTLESNSASRLGKFLDQVFANNLAGDEVMRTRRSRRTAAVADPDDPPDPITYEESRWTMTFSDYELGGDKVTNYVSMSFALMSYAQIGTDMIVNSRSPLSDYPSTSYYQNLFPPGSSRILSFTLSGPAPFLYEDLMMSLKLFISWTGAWQPDNERRVPSTSMVLEKETAPMSTAEIASGIFKVQGMDQT